MGSNQVGTFQPVPMTAIGEMRVNGVTGWTATFVAEKLGGVSRQAVHDYAIRHNWRVLGQVGRVIVYNARDARASLDKRAARYKLEEIKPEAA